MRVLVVHNSYQTPGGEDVAVAQETLLLEGQGHEVISYSRSNDELKNLSSMQRLLFVKDLVYSSESKCEIETLLLRKKPDVVHVHNTFMMISPSVFDACQKADIPVLQTLHNYRLLCPAWTLSRNGRVCEDCVEGGLWHGIWHGCYRESHAITAAVAAMLKFHRISGTWNNSVDGYVALSEFARRKFIEGGLPANKIYVKPNFVRSDPGEKRKLGSYALFVGRLSPEKGMQTLLSAWTQMSQSYPLVVIGDGPLRESLEAEVAKRNISSVTFKGWLPRAQTIEAIKNSSFLVVPSLWYEGFPMTIAEAFACGTPVLCSKLGGMQEIVDDGRTGLHFEPGNATDLASKLTALLAQPGKIAQMGIAARWEYKSRYTAARNYSLLMQIYEQSIRTHSGN